MLSNTAFKEKIIEKLKKEIEFHTIIYNDLLKTNCLNNDIEKNRFAKLPSIYITKNYCIRCYKILEEDIAINFLNFLLYYNF